ncbi:AbrB family transcriptional regulator [Bradyrhizobium sp. Arg237L]|uniref:AbrB family transcriptional regulator n=1 Tax=Bradyrhizobium sp. Arg237L TaxID=3003352 RepID=UPI00249EFE46|nr:AbrB family transcriptional regulator [Bradyrhizobium sp. Arg237L]MDI4231405.1 AbrB family transcriptional regulator [Bradyrhizobium sp. Arg237L]
MSEPQAYLPLQPLPVTVRWAVLFAASLLLAGVLQWVRLPAALLLGPLAAAALVQMGGGAVRVPRLLIVAAQAIIGCLVAQSITPAIISGFVRYWPIILATVALSVGASALIGWTMSRLRIIPGTTAVWGMLPGAATVMMVMAEAHGADFRLVAFMQYLRVVLVAAAASVVALWFAHGGGGRFSAGLFPPVDLTNLGATAAIALVGAGLAARMPAGVLLGPLVLGAVFNVLGWVKIELPPLVLIATYTLIGWNTGLRFTRDVLATAARALPQSIGATAILMAFCGLLAWLLVEFLHVDPLTAYLATSPGGIDAAAIIAASTKVDTSFVMALQTVRVILLLFVGPSVARWVAGTLDRTSASPGPDGAPDLGNLD